MNDARSRSQRRWIAVIVGGVVGQLYGIFCLRVLLARLGGASMGEALRRALWVGGPAPFPLHLIAASAVGLTIYLLVVRRGAGGRGAAPGAVIWRRLRFAGVTGALLLALASAAAYLASILEGGGGTEGWEWIALMLLALFAAGALLFYLKKPTPEYLHALETGDRSRLEDERAQRVGGAAAAITLTIFVPILFFGGVLYEVLVRGEWPIRTGVELGVILLIWGLAGRHWNRAL